MGSLLFNNCYNENKSSKEMEIDCELNNEKIWKEGEIIFNSLNYSLKKIFTFKNDNEIIDIKILKNGKIAICELNCLNIYKYK